MEGSCHRQEACSSPLGGCPEAFTLFNTDGLTIVTFAPVSTIKVTSTPETRPFTRGPSSVSTMFAITGWRVGSLAVQGAAELRLASPAGSRLPTAVAFFLGNHAACGPGDHKWSNLSNCLVDTHFRNCAIHHVVVRAVLVLQGVCWQPAVFIRLAVVGHSREETWALGASGRGGS